MRPTRHTGATLSFQPRIRKGAFFDAAWRHGCRSFSVYNRTYISSAFFDPLDEYWNVIQNVSIWPVMGERQVEISGPDALSFLQLLTPRDMSQCAVNQCKYALITDQDGGIISDPIVLRLNKDRFWLSTSDSDLELWAKGVAIHSTMDVKIRDANVSVVQVQGPKSPRLMANLFGDRILDLKYYWLTTEMFQGHPLKISRTGWSGEFGYEVYLEQPDQGDALFDALLEAGQGCHVAPGTVNQARRIEAGILSWGVDMTQETTPFDVGLDRLVEFSKRSTFIGRDRLWSLKDAPRSQAIVGLKIEGDPLPGNEEFWAVSRAGRTVGQLTSLAYSPRLKTNIALARVAPELSTIGEQFDLETSHGPQIATVSRVPFLPKKQTGSARDLIAVTST